MIKQTEINLFETGQAPMIQKVKVGDKIKTKEKYGDGDDTRMVTWIVKKVHPYFVYATAGNKHKCFNYGMLVQLGLEQM